MKKLIYILLSALALLLCSCSQDKGNYEYIELNEPVITGLQDMSVLTFSELEITPQLGGTFPAEEYSFEWKVLDNSGAAEPVVIGNELALKYEVALAPGSPVGGRW